VSNLFPYQRAQERTQKRHPVRTARTGNGGGREGREVKDSANSRHSHERSIQGRGPQIMGEEIFAKGSEKGKSSWKLMDRERGTVEGKKDEQQKEGGSRLTIVPGQEGNGNR